MDEEDNFHFVELCYGNGHRDGTVYPTYDIQKYFITSYLRHTIKWTSEDAKVPDIYTVRFIFINEETKSNKLT